jgi:hypothetical protein
MLKPVPGAAGIAVPAAEGQRQVFVAEPIRVGLPIAVGKDPAAHDIEQDVFAP